MLCRSADVTHTTFWSWGQAGISVPYVHSTPVTLVGTGSLRADCAFPVYQIRWVLGHHPVDPPPLPPERSLAIPPLPRPSRGSGTRLGFLKFSPSETSVDGSALLCPVSTVCVNRGSEDCILSSCIPAFPDRHSCCFRDSQVLTFYSTLWWPKAMESVRSEAIPGPTIYQLGDLGHRTQPL